MPELPTATRSVYRNAGGSSAGHFHRSGFGETYDWPEGANPAAENYPLFDSAQSVLYRRRMTDFPSNPTREQLRLEGFDLIDGQLKYLLSCLEEALVSTGATELLPYLPWSGREPAAGAAPEGLPQLYSIGFQLLNMVEERVAAEIRRARRSSPERDSLLPLDAAKPRELKDLP